MCQSAAPAIVTPSKHSPLPERNPIMNKRIRTALAALLIAFAIAFSAHQLGGFSQFDMAGSGGIRPSPAMAGYNPKPPGG